MLTGETVEKIKPNLMVHAKGTGEMNGAKGVHVGTVDHIETDEYIKLSKSDSQDGRHHWIPTAWIEKIDDQAVYLNKSEEEFYAELLDKCPTDVEM